MRTLVLLIALVLLGCSPSAGEPGIVIGSAADPFLRADASKLEIHEGADITAPTQGVVWPDGPMSFKGCVFVHGRCIGCGVGEAPPR